MIIQHSNAAGFLYKPCPQGKIGKSISLINVGSAACEKCEYCGNQTKYSLECNYDKTEPPELVVPAIL